MRLPAAIAIALLVIPFMAACSGVSLFCRVDNVEWVGVERNDSADNLELGGNPESFGGGDRVFPDRNHPIGSAGSDLHDRVRVRATLADAVSFGKSYVVHFRLFDEDHYSADGQFDPNGGSADDNVRSGGTPSPGARLVASDFTAASTMAIVTHNLASPSPPNTAELGLQLSDLQPGNNWKVAAFCSGEVVQTEEGPFIPPPPEDWGDTPRTPLLTVWRHLNVEADVLSDPIFNTGIGQSKFDSGLATKTGPETVRLLLGGGASIASANQFEEGNIELLSAAGQSVGAYDIFSNTTGPTPTIRVIDAGPAGDLPAGIARFRNLIDDDLHNPSAFRVERSDDMDPDRSNWHAYFEPALVVPRFDVPEVQSTWGLVPFNTNVEDSELRSIVSANRGSVSEPGFWVVYQVGAFQGAIDSDNDPPQEIGSLGVAIVRSTDTAGGTFVFSETIRDHGESPPLFGEPEPINDIPACKEWIAIHELGHSFGIDHGPEFGSIMAAALDTSCTAAHSPKTAWSGKALRTITLSEQP